MTYPSKAEISDESLDELIKMIHSNLITLVEMKKARGQDIHVALRWKYLKGSKKRIARVTCSCKEVTEYKVPLDDIKDFECPKEGK